VPLAIDSYGDLKALGDSASLLNLAWTIDERQCIGINLDDLIAAELKAESSEGLPFMNRYLVDDPYGEGLLSGPVRAYFANSDWSPCIVSGAGVISLLQALAALTRDTQVHVVGNTYPDFPHWIHVAGGVHTSQRGQAEMIFLERPSLMGDQLDGLGDVRKLCFSASERGAVVLVDESNANYRPPAFSAVNLTAEVDNLIVLRGMSKGYGMGGLRLGLCIASELLQGRVRKVVPPLLASSLSLRIGARILSMGDVAEPLRERIRVNRDIAKALLVGAGFGVVDASEGFPYLFLRGDPSKVLPELEARGVLGKSHMIWSSSDRSVQVMPRVSVPLSEARMEILQRALSGSARR